MCGRRDAPAASFRLSRRFCAVLTGKPQDAALPAALGENTGCPAFFTWLTGGAAGLLAVFFSLAFNNYFLKNLFERIRPYEVIDGLTLLVHKASDFSFPSGHAGSSFAAATAFFWILRGKIGAAAYVLAFLIAFSRLYIGIHYPTDVLCGMITGSLCGLAAGVLINKAKSKLEEFKAAKSR